MPITDKIEQVITDLGDTRDDLTALLDDIWLDIDHTNQASIKNGSERMISTLDAAANFRKAGDELTAKLRGFLPPSPVVPAPPTTAPSATAPATPAQQHNYFASMEQISLTTSWTYRRPAGFALRGKQSSFHYTWSSLYLRLLHTLRESDRTLFDTLPDRPEFTSNHNNPYITRDRSRLRDASKVGDTVFVETNLNANLIRDNIRYIVKAFGIKDTEVQIFLRR